MKPSRLHSRPELSYPRHWILRNILYESVYVIIIMEALSYRSFEGLKTSVRLKSDTSSCTLETNLSISVPTSRGGAMPSCDNIICSQA